MKTYNSPSYLEMFEEATLKFKPEEWIEDSKEEENVSGPCYSKYSVVHRLTASASPGNLLEVQVIWVCIGMWVTTVGSWKPSEN
jgi:hypothetical protein